MFKDIHLYSLSELVDDHDNFIGHTDKGGGSDEKLSEHLELTFNHLRAIIDKKNMQDILGNLFTRFNLKSGKMNLEIQKFIKELFFNAVALHDIGKINPLFQKKIKNPKFVNFSDITLKNSDHSMLSALIYVDIFERKIEGFQDKNVKCFLKYFLYSFACSISRHHSYLYDLKDFIEKLDTCRKNFSLINESICYRTNTIFEKEYKADSILGLFERCRVDWNVDEINFYILNKTLYSLIVSSDFYATYEFYTKKQPQMGLLDDVDELINKYSQTELYHQIVAYKNNQSVDMGAINNLRSEMYIEAEENLISQLDKNIYFLEAPTGSGKTNTSINLALSLTKKNEKINKIFYIFPFNTLVEQTATAFEKIFERGKDFAVVNSITPIIIRDKNDKKDENEEDYKVENAEDYERSLLDRQFLHYPIVITTHINLFNYLFGNGREANFPITQLCNSVVILDEIQSYRNKIWKEIINFLSAYSKILNIKIIIMSATLPRLDKLLFDQEEFGILIKDRNKYFENPVFKDRVKIDLSLLQYGKIELEELAEVIDKIVKENGKKKILIEFIKKKTARNFYNIIKDKFREMEGIRLVELTGDDSKHTRNKLLDEIKSLEGVIVVATQVIEAGVDIDMDIGFKDISLIDSEEQFLGRINRSCGKTGSVAYFFNHDDVKDIYKEDLRIGTDLCMDEGRIALETKNFEGFYDLCFERIKQKKDELNKNNINNLIQALESLNYNCISSWMKLITQKTYQIYLEHVIEVDGKSIDGKGLWGDYIELCENRKLSYSEKKIKLSEYMEKINYFTYNIIAYDDVTMPFPLIGGFYHVRDGSRFIDEDGKFDRETFERECKSVFL